MRWDLEAEPLPEIPLPNDVATWPDPTSPTGLRVNASVIAPSGMERRLRQEFDRLDGWGTFAPLTVAFDAPLDVEELLRRQGRHRFGLDAWPHHAVYVVDLKTGLPVPLDVHSGRFPHVVVDPNAYYANDPHAGESNLLFETREEDSDGDGVLDPGEDTDYDGVLDHPNTIEGHLTGVPHETIDRLLSFYERETRTLILRPILPLEENRTYAVVLTDRLRGADGQPVRSPFRHVHHAAQYDALASLPALLAERAHLYGDLASRGWDGVSFAWTFTTQSIRGDLTALREGLYGRGPFTDLAERFPATLVPVPLRGGTRIARCEPGRAVYTVTPRELGEAMRELPIDGWGIPAAQLDAILAALERSVSHFALGFFESPYLLGDPDLELVQDTWDMDRRTGEARIDRDVVAMFIAVPKEAGSHRQPFPTALYAHGYGSLNLEAIAFAGLIASHGVATVSIHAQGHGLPVGDSLAALIESVLARNCLAPLGRALAIDRARDLNEDGSADPAGLFFSAHVFHTRDTLRQTTLDWLQAVRILRSWQGHPSVPDGFEWEPGEVQASTGPPLEFSGDVDGDGSVDRAGDFDGDGIPDLGGWDVEYSQWGSSLGGIVSMLNLGVEPAITAAAPVSGGAGLLDIAMRTGLSEARHPVWLHVLGPIVASRPSLGPSDDTSCAEGDRSLFFEVPDLTRAARTEFACVAEDLLGEGAVVVLENRRNSEVRCAGVDEQGRFRIEFPASKSDRLRLTIYGNASGAIDYRTCAFVGGGAPPILDVIDTWRSGHVERGGEAMCLRCGTYQQERFVVGEPLVAPAEGLGLPRQSPDLRRLAGLAQMALDPADPINYARHVFLDPVTAADVPVGRPRSAMIISTAGDPAVPPSASYAYARAAGVLAFLPPDGPDELADWRAPTRFGSRYGRPTPDDVLIDYHVLEALPQLHRHPVDEVPHFLFDVDDLSDGQQFFASDGSRQVPPESGGLRPLRLDPPLRWSRQSRPAAAAEGDPWESSSDFSGTSIVLNAMTLPIGQHVISPVDPAKLFDEGEYLINVIGWYLASHGTELAWDELSDPFCLQDSSCARE